MPTDEEKRLEDLARRLGLIEARFAAIEALITTFQSIDSKTVSHLARFNEVSHMAHQALPELRAVVSLQEGRQKVINRYVDKHVKKAV